MSTHQDPTPSAPCHICGEPLSSQGKDICSAAHGDDRAPSLQSVAEGAARECASILAPFNYYADRQDEAALEFTSILTRHFAPVYAAREAETRDWIKWHGALQEQLQDAQAQIAERDERIGRLEALTERIQAWANKWLTFHRGRAEEMRKERDAAQADLTALRTRCEELQRDKERLDWLNRTDDGYFDWFTHPRDVRAAIDAARKEGQQAHQKGEGT